MTTIEFNKQLIDLRTNLNFYALKLTANEEDANDLLQDTMLKALTYKDKFVERSTLKSWMFTIMKNIFINNYRRNIRKYAILGNIKNTNNTVIRKNIEKSQPETSYNLDEITDIVESLADEYRIPFQMFYDGYKYNLSAPRSFLARKPTDLSLHYASLHFGRDDGGGFRFAAFRTNDMFLQYTYF